MELISIKGTFYNGTKYNFTQLHHLVNTIAWHKDRIKECENSDNEALRARKPHHEAIYTVLALRLKQHKETTLKTK